jgi:hypothetical protein
LRERLARDARHRLDQQVAAAIPNYQEIDRDPYWHRFLLGVDPYTGRVRQALLNEAVASGNANRVIAFFRGFLQEERAGGTQASGRARSTPSKKPIYTRTQIDQLYAAHRRGAYTGREAEWARQEADIFAAIREGRVTGGPCRRSRAMIMTVPVPASTRRMRGLSSQHQESRFFKSILRRHEPEPPRYRQAVLRNKPQAIQPAGSIERVPAAEVEALVMTALRNHLQASGTVPADHSRERAGGGRAPVARRCRLHGSSALLSSRIFDDRGNRLGRKPCLHGLLWGDYGYDDERKCWWASNGRDRQYRFVVEEIATADIAA